MFREAPTPTTQGSRHAPRWAPRLGVAIGTASLLLLAPASGVAAGSPARLAVSAVSAPPTTLRAGSRFTVTGTVTNQGRRAASGAGIAFTLRADGQPPLAYRLGRTQLGRVAPGATRPFRATLRLGRTDPAADPTRSFALTGCLDGHSGPDACRTSPTRTRIEAPSGPVYAPGAQSLGDSLFPTIGNGGYDARHYDLDLDYDVAAKRLDGTAGIDAVATQDLSRFSFDLTSWNVVQRVTVDGRRATFAVDAEHSKLVVTPPGGIRNGARFRTVVRYGGVQQPFPGTTSLHEGWIPDPENGAVVLAQPVGAMGWYPNNDVPADKATYTTRITVPYGFSALATGVLAARHDSGTTPQDTSSFVWDDADPTSTYLVSVSIGRFDVNSLDPAHPVTTTPAAGSPNPSLPFYTAVTSSMPDAGKAQSTADLGRSSEIVDDLSAYYGIRYPFSSLGGIVTLQPFYLGLETQGKPTYAISDFDASGGPGIYPIVHELAHQWFGDLVTPARWSDLWLSEGMAVFSSWVWLATELPNSSPPRDQYLDVYDNPDYPISWRVPPAAPAAPGDLFDRDAMYRRGPATIEAIREILGNDATFKAMIRRWLSEHAYGNATTEQFVALVEETDPSRAARWTEFFRQWLYTSYPTASPDPGQPEITRPPMNADNFDSYVLPAG